MTRGLDNEILTAARAVRAVVDRGHKLDRALADNETAISPRRRAWLRAVSYGGCRYYHRFDAMFARLLTKPLPPPRRLAHFILINAGHQLTHMHTPPYAVVHQSVAAVKRGRYAWAAPLINAVLRKFIARAEPLAAELTPAAAAAMPAWLYEMVRESWPEQCAQICAAGLAQPPLTVRVNTAQISREAYLQKLRAAGLGAAPCEHSAIGVNLNAPMPVAQIPGFQAGQVSVQDESSQLAAAALACRPQDRVLDRCAAPGGKTCQLLEAEPSLAVVAVDTPPRISSVNENLRRLGLGDLAVQTIAADPVVAAASATAVPKASAEVRADNTAAAGMNTAGAWHDGRLFDRILVDAPCSGSGVIRRHPDIKHRRRPTDIPKFAAQQFALLNEVWPALRGGGQLLYATCSILPAENDAVIARFLAAEPTARAVGLAADFGLATRHGRQRLPGVHLGDGFYYAKLTKTTGATDPVY